MTQTQTIQTQYGSVEIETVDCDSCGTTIGKQEAQEFTIGDREGFACEHCVDNGPISFPPTADIQVNLEPAGEGWPIAFILWPIVFPVFIFDTSRRKGMTEFLLGSITAILWTLGVIFILNLVGVL